MTMRPATLNFHWYPHATFSERQVLKDADGIPLDLSGYTALMHIRRYREDAAPLYELSTATGEIVLGGTDGSIELVVAADATDDATLIDPDGEAWVHDILLTNPADTPSTVDRVYQGFVFVHPGVTRP